MAYRHAPQLAWQRIEGEAVIIDLARGRTLGLNPVGSLIWALVPDHPEAAIAEEVSRQFDVPYEEARLDVSAFLRSLQDGGLVLVA